MSSRREQALAEALTRASPRRDHGADWWRGAVIYEIYVRSFQDTNGDGVGDLPGVLARLDHVVDLGADAIWLAPFYPSPQEDFGYDITDHRDVDPIFGTLDDAERVIEAAHARGLKVLLDLVALHTSRHHPWFLESREDRTNPRADWYVWADPSRDGTAPNNWLSSFGGQAWTWEPRREQYYYHPFLSCQPALNLRHPLVVEAILDIMRFWFDRDVDGLRLDAVQCLGVDPDLRDNPPAPRGGNPVHIGGGEANPFARQLHLFDRDVPEAVGVVERLRALAASYAPERLLIGEVADMDSARGSEKLTSDDDRLHAVYDFDLVNTAGDVAGLIEIAERRERHLPTGWMIQAFANHDSKRAVSNFAPRAVAAGQAREAAKALLFLQFTLKGGAILYQGEELGLVSPDLDLEHLRDPWGINLWPSFKGRDPARTPMPWTDDAAHFGFSEATPWLPAAPEHRGSEVATQALAPDSPLAFVRAFLRWRRGQPVLWQGSQETGSPDLAPLVVFDRVLPSGQGTDETRLRCLVNLGEHPIVPDASLVAGQNLDAPGCVPLFEDRPTHLPAFGFALLTTSNAGRLAGKKA